MLTRNQLHALLQPAMSIGEAEENTRRAVAERFELHDNLTSTQARCTALLEEKRALAAELRTLKPQPFVNTPSKPLRAVFVLGTSVGGAALMQSTGVVGSAFGALIGAVVGFAATFE